MTAKLVSKKDGSTYEYDPENCSAQAVNAMFGVPTAYLQHGNDAIFADETGVFRGLRAGETYAVVPREEGAPVPPETAAEILRERLSEKDRSKSPVQARTELLLAFHRIDSNHNGVIEFEEFKALLAELGRPIAEDEARKAFDMLDTDGNGVIDFAEFYSFYTQPKPTDLLSRLGSFLGSLIPTLLPGWSRV